jgi:peptidyl-tRNA hydrolase
MDAAGYVLEAFDKEESFYLDQILSQAAESLKVLLLEGLEAAMNRFQKTYSPFSISMKIFP